MTEEIKIILQPLVKMPEGSECQPYVSLRDTDLEWLAGALQPYMAGGPGPTPEPQPPEPSPPATVTMQVPWGTNRLEPKDYGGFSAGATIVLQVDPPEGAQSFDCSIAEFQGPPTARTLSLSTSPGDFSTPLKIAYGNSCTIVATPTAMALGGSLYINARNAHPDYEGCTCHQERCDAVFDFHWS